MPNKNKIIKKLNQMQVSLDNAQDNTTGEPTGAINDTMLRLQQMRRLSPAVNSAVKNALGDFDVTTKRSAILKAETRIFDIVRDFRGRSSDNAAGLIKAAETLRKLTGYGAKFFVYLDSFEPLGAETMSNILNNARDYLY